MVKVVVEVKKPFEVSEARPPLVPGMFAEVAIRGKSVERSIACRGARSSQTGCGGQ
jgi:hypothetical protein